MVTLVNNRGYEWSHYNGVHFKGVFINGDNVEIFRGKRACDFFAEIPSFTDFIELLKSNSGGAFSVVIEKKEKTWMAVDVARSMPLYFSIDGHYISDSAESIRVSLGLAKEAVDKDCLSELYARYFLFGDKTVYRNIRQLDLCEAVEITPTGITKKKYFYHQNKVDNSSVGILRQKIEKASYAAFARLKTMIEGRPVVLSMSGGYDSRFIGCMLKNVGVEDVSCYTYGKPTSFEVIQSRRNAEALGFRWTCVEMTDELQKRNLDEVGLQYFNYYNGHDFTAYMQNFTAVRKLHEDGWFKPGSVFLTGLCGDMPTGEYVLPYDSQKEYSLTTAVAKLWDDFYSQVTYDEDREYAIKKGIQATLEDYPIQINDYQTWHSAIDCFTTGTSHSHWFMHMNTVHSFFGYEWLLPYWDKELLMAWYSVPAEQKVKQKFYEDWLMEVICKPYGLSQKKINWGYSRRPLIRKIQYSMGAVANYVLLHIGIPFKRKQDFSNFAPFELELFKNIKTRSCINYRKGGMMRLLALYLIERRYGSDNVRQVNRRVFLED